MQATYPKKLSTIHWDTLNVDYPVRQFLQTGISSESLARRWRDQPDVIREIVALQWYCIGLVQLRTALGVERAKPVAFIWKGSVFDLHLPTKGYHHTKMKKETARQTNIEEVEYSRNYNVTKELTQSQTALDYGHKPAERFRFNKHTSCRENEYIYPPSRKLADRVPATTAHQSTEMRCSYETPSLSSRLVTDKDQYKYPPLSHKETGSYKEIEPLDTTYEGYEKYLDPYLTTSRLHHRPYTADELSKPSNSRDIMTYYTYADIPWVWSPKPKDDIWYLPMSRPKSMYDREKFKEGFREIRTHNKLRWVPGTFRTESRDNYVQQTSRPESQIHNDEEKVRSLYQRATAQLSTNILQEDLTTLQRYSTENSSVGSRKPTCVVFDPYVEKNRRLTFKLSRTP